MSSLSVAILGLFILAFVMQMAIKKVKIKTLDALLEVKNFDEVIRTCGTKYTKRLLTSYVCYIYTLRAYWLKNDNNVFLDKLFEIINSIETESEKRNILEIYFHLYILREDSSSSKKLLDEILLLENVNFKKASQFAYDVANNLPTNFKAYEIDLEAYKGFDLGVVVYNLAWSYYKSQDLEKAKEYFYSCSSCFHANHYYANKAKMKYDELHVTLAND